MPKSRYRVAWVVATVFIILVAVRCLHDLSRLSTEPTLPRDAITGVTTQGIIFSILIAAILSMPAQLPARRVRSAAWLPTAVLLSLAFVVIGHFYLPAAVVPLVADALYAGAAIFSIPRRRLFEPR